MNHGDLPLKGATARELYAIVDYNLLGPGTWPASGDLLQRFNTIVRDGRLDEADADDPRTSRFTPLGKELKVKLLMAFAGTWEISEIPYILQEDGYLEESEVEELFIGPPSEPEFERKVRWHVRRAYFRFCNWSSLVN